MVKDYKDYIFPPKKEENLSFTYDYYFDATTLNYLIIGIVAIVFTVVFFQKMIR